MAKKTTEPETEALLRDLAKVKAAFQQRTILAVLSEGKDNKWRIPQIR